MCEAASLYSVFGTALYLLLHGMIWEALVFLCLKVLSNEGKDLCSRNHWELSMIWGYIIIHTVIYSRWSLV